MANTLTNIIPTIFARALLALRDRTVMPQLVNRDYETEAKEKGDTVSIPVPTSVGTRAVSPSYQDPTDADDTTPAKVSLALDNWRQTDPFYLTDQDMSNAMVNANFIPMQLSEALKGLTDYVNAQILALYTGVYGFVGTPGVTPFAENTPVADVAADAMKILNEQECPQGDRRAVLDFAGEAAAVVLPAFAHASKVGDNSVVREGRLGRLYGMDWYSDGDVPSHTLGAAGTPLVDDADGVAVGTKLIHMDGFTTKPSVGDIFTIPNRAAGTTDAQTYTVTASTALDGTDSDVSFEPGLKVALAAGDDSTAVNFKATHVVNLAFHRDAFAFASRPLLDTDITGEGNMTTIADPVTGLVYRLEVKRQHKRTAWEVDILFGCKLVRAELACRIAG